MNTVTEKINKPYDGKTIAGIIIIAIGAFLLVDQFNLFAIPHWLFSWPMWMIGWGLYMGSKYNFQKTGWLIVTAIGVIFLITENINHSDNFVWPIAFVGVGLWLVFKHNKKVEDQSFTNYKEV